MASVLAGRDAERRALNQWLDEALAGSPRIVVMSGEAGAGKTSLLDRFGVDARQRGVPAVIGRAIEQDGAPPLWPWRLVLRELGSAELLDAPQFGDEPTQRFVRFDRVSTWLQEQASSSGGLVIGIDDVHCADPPSLRLLVHLADSLRSTPVILVITYRSAMSAPAHFTGVLDDLVGLPAQRSLVLRRLDRSAVAEILGAAEGSDTVERVHELSGGNALFVSELARQLAAGLALDDIPDSLRALVVERLAVRSVPCAELLRTASVVGREFAAGVAANAVGRPVLETLALVDEAVRAGLVLPAHEPGRFTFTHLLVRDIIEATIPVQERPVLHRRVAAAIEAYEGATDDHVHEIARHWDQAAILGERDVAAEWSERAAIAADRALAWEQAARLYERALALQPADTAPEVRHRRSFGAARALLHSDLIEHAMVRCTEAAAAAHQAGRADLAADVALLVEGRGGSGGAEALTVLGIAERALDALDPSDHTRRARLLGLLAALTFYIDPARSEPLSSEASAAAARSGSPRAVVAAARARQMVRFGPEHVDERLDLARQIGDAGRALQDPSVTQWESLWRIDALLELGRIREAAAELPALRRSTDATGHPLSRWHRCRSEAVIAAATGRWDDARRFGEGAYDIQSRLESVEGATSLELALQTSIGMHVGFAPDVLAGHDRLDLTRAPAYISDIPIVLPLLAKLGTGRRDEAARDHGRLAPVGDWTPPPFLWLALHVMRLLAACELDRRGDIAAIVDRLEPHRGRHVAGGGGPIVYLGCVELHLGHGSLVLGELDAAVVDLRAAVDAAASATTPPFEIRAAVLLAEALARRAGADDLTEADALARTYEPRAVALGMHPWRERLARLMVGVDDVADDRLSPRELEVADLVARGLSNKEIAAELFISSRTAQNHVQHILVKLGLGNRTQIAHWHHQRRR